MTIPRWDDRQLARLEVMLGLRGNPADKGVRFKDLKLYDLAFARINRVLIDKDRSLNITSPTTPVLIDGLVSDRTQYHILAEGPTDMDLESYRGVTLAWENPLTWTIQGRAQAVGDYPTRIAMGMVWRNLGDVDWLSGNAVGQQFWVSGRYERFYGISYIDQTEIFDDAPNVPREWALWAAVVDGELPARVSDFRVTLYQTNG